jgi:hypothetical protein
MTAVLLLAATAVGSPAGKVPHSESSIGGLQDDEDKRSTGHTASRRSVDMTYANEHADDSNLPRNVLPDAYHLELHPFPEEGYFTGCVRINVTCHKATHAITLHADENLQIAHSEVTVRQLGGGPPSLKLEDPSVKRDRPFNDQGSAASSLMPLTISSTKKEPSKQWYVISLTDSLKKNVTYQVELSFIGNLTSITQGFFHGSYQLHRTKEQRWFAATRLSSCNARHVFPCFDEPDLKAPFEISVAKNGRRMALSNMPIKLNSEIIDETGWTWVHFQTTPPISTSSVAVAVLDLESTSATTKGGVNVSVFARSNFVSEVEGIAEKASLILEFIEDYLAVPFPLSKLDLVAVPHYSDPESANHLGLILLKESDFMNEDAVSWRLAVEITQQWLGHVVTPASLADARINKALTNYVAKLAAKQDKWNWNPAASYSLYYEYGRRHPYADLGSQEEYINVARLQWVLRMINYTLTEATFRHGLSKFLQERKFVTFSEDEVWEALTSQAREDKTLAGPATVQQIVKSWVTKDRLPVVTVTRDYQDNSACVEQHVFLKESPPDMSERETMLWWVPLIYVTPDNMEPHGPVTWMKDERHTNISNLPGPESFVILNPEEIGLFMVNYDQQNWGLLLDYLRGPGSQIPTATRAKLLHDAWNLAYAGELDIATALNMTLFLEQETELAVWDAMFTMIDHLGRRISGTDAGLKFEEYARSLLTRLKQSLGNPRPDESSKTAKLRSNADSVLCQLGHQPCVADAREEFSKWMQNEDPDAGNFVPESYICTVFQWGTMEEWEFGLQRFIHLPAYRKQFERSYLLKTLAGCPRQEEKVDRILYITLLEDSDNFTDSDVRLVLNMLTGSSTGYTTLFKFLSQNWEELRQRLMEKPSLWEYLVHSATEMFKTLDGYNMVSELYVAHQGEFGTAEQIVEQALCKISTEAQWSDVNLPAMEIWLDNHLPSITSATELN